MTQTNIGKFTTVETQDNGIVLRHTVSIRTDKEFFVGANCEDALLEVLQARKAAREAAAYQAEMLEDLPAAVDAVKGREISNDAAWEIIDRAAAAFLPEGTLVSWDGMHDAIVEPVDEEWEQVRLRVTDLEAIKAIVLEAAV
jgi:hypothetical protein